MKIDNSDFIPPWITKIRKNHNEYLKRTKLTLYKNREWYNAYEYDAIIITKLFQYRLFIRGNKLCIGFTNKSLNQVLANLTELNIGYIILDHDEVLKQFLPELNIYQRLIERCDFLLSSHNLTLTEYKTYIKKYHEGLRGGDLTEKFPKEKINVDKAYDFNDFYNVKLSETEKKETKSSTSPYIKHVSEMTDDEFLDACFPKHKKETNHENLFEDLPKQISTSAPPWESNFKPGSLSVRIDDRVLLEDLSDGSQFSVIIKASTVSYVPTWFGDSSRSKYKTQTTQKIDYHTDYSKGEYSDRSPLGKAILGKRVGDIVSFKPDNSIIFQKVKILKIEAP